MISSNQRYTTLRRRIFEIAIEIVNFIFFHGLKRYGKRVHIDFPCRFRGKKAISLGDDVSIAAFVHIWGHGGVTIGNRVMIGTHTSITSLTHDLNSEDMYFTPNIEKPVTIRDDVWIGSNAVIMPGVTVGKGAVVGAGSVVTNNVPPYAVVAGVPAKLLHYRNVK